MILKPIKREEIPNINYKKTVIQELLQEFRESDFEAAEVTNHHYKNPTSAMSTISEHIKRQRIKSVKCITRDKKVYLIKTIGEE